MFLPARKRLAIVRQFRFTSAMSQTQPLSYSAAVGTSSHQKSPKHIQTTNTTATAANAKQEQAPPKKRSPSPSHVPRTAAAEDNVYVLTLLTDRGHHDRMTALRKRYFPQKLNKLAAHLTLFHALPGSRMDSHIIPTIEEVAARTSPFRVRADAPFRMKKGFAVSISDGGKQGSAIHRSLQGPWKADGFLSDQDAGNSRLHYTLMNKVDDENVVSKAYREMVENWNGDEGTVEGLALWRYERGYWKWERKFDFRHE